jgi:hypothetical protein
MSARDHASRSGGEEVLWMLGIVNLKNSVLVGLECNVEIDREFHWVRVGDSGSLSFLGRHQVCFVHNTADENGCTSR